RSQPLKHARIMSKGIGRADQPPAGSRTLDLRSLRAHRLVECESAQQQIKPSETMRIAQFLRELVLLRRILRHGGDRQAGEIAVIGREPVPESPCGNSRKVAPA